MPKIEWIRFALFVALAAMMIAPILLAPAMQGAG